MLKNLTRLLLLNFMVFFAASSVYAAEKFTIDNQHSYVLWRINHLGFSTQAGKWFVNGFVELDKDKPQNSKVEVTIDIASIDTGLPELDKHLKAAEFFDVEHFPKATFVSDKVDLTGKDTAKVDGVLTLHGVSKPVTLMVTLNKEGPNPIYDRFTVGFTAKASIKRSDFGIKTLIPQLSDEIPLEIAVEAFKPKA